MELDRKIYYDCRSKPKSLPMIAVTCTGKYIYMTWRFGSDIIEQHRFCLAWLFTYQSRH
jgi:hypothetical protein